MRKQKQNGINNLFEDYCDPCFGARSKKETDLLILEAMFANGYLNINMSDYEVANKLNLTISRVKSLKYDFDIRFIKDNSEWLVERIREAIVNAHVYDSQSGLRFALHSTSKLVSQEIEKILTDNDTFCDYSFNRNILTLDSDSFLALLRHIFKHNDLSAIENRLKKASGISGPSDLKSLITNFLKSGIKAAGKPIGEKVGGLIATIITGGINQIKDLLD